MLCLPIRDIPTPRLPSCDTCRYMQPGYDALGFISCTGTNFVVRAAALKEVGGSPTYTLTEDFALGMALKMYGWHCRYVQVGAHETPSPAMHAADSVWRGP